MSIFNHFQHLKLTDDQRTALESIETFLEGDGSVFMLKGYAVTGKTTLLHGICRYLASRQSDFRLMAPIGRAAMILNQKTEAETSTIHRCIYNLNDIGERNEGTALRYFMELKVKVKTIEVYGYKTGQGIKGKAMLSFNKVKYVWGWKVLNSEIA